MDMISSGAEIVYPAKVESAIYAHRAVADVAVSDIPDPRWGEAVRAMIVLKTDSSASPDEIIAHARQPIAGFNFPRSVEGLAALPRNDLGRFLRRKLRAPFGSGRGWHVN